MKRVHVAENPVDAQFVKAFLESAGIAAVVRGEHLFALRGSVPMTAETLPSVWIEDEDDLARAQRLLEGLEKRSHLRAVDDEREPDATDDESWEEAGSAG
jgi:hypothetical protein